jgi:hypothetical protein
MDRPRALPIAILLALAASAMLTNAARAGRGGELQSRSTDQQRAWRAAPSLPTVGGAWTELTSLPYDLEEPRYRAPAHDQWFAGSGYGFAGGRIQALAIDGDTVYAGAASGGVWRSPDRGETWTPVTDDLPNLSSGDLAIDPSDGTVWYATGRRADTRRSTAASGSFGQAMAAMWR